MLSLTYLGTLLAAAVGLVAAAPTEQPMDKRYSVKRDGVTHNIFKHAATGAKLDYVTNSGICETTPGVNQYSGYLSVGSNMNMFFWFFEARNNPTTAPLAIWLNGGPGCSSLIGLFQENGPCHFVNGQSTPSNNTYSWNNVANVLYVDQPIGVGYSYGTDDATSTVTAAPYVWQLLQAFYAQFPQYKNRNFNLFTESYGGHYGPEFAYYFQSQNSKIAAGTLNATTIPLVSLGINNGWYDPLINYEAYITFSANNSYRNIISSSQAASYQNDYNNRCAPALKKCTGLTGTNNACINAENICYQYIEGAIQEDANFDVYDIREPSNDPYPPTTYENYVNSASVRQAIGAQGTWSQCSNSAGQKFSSTGDDSRSLLATLGTVVSSGIQVVLWAGDADWICNYQGGFATANAVKWSGQSSFSNLPLKSYTVGGTAGGLYKTLNNLSWLQVYGAGHEVPYYAPAVALQVFTQTINRKPLSST